MVNRTPWLAVKVWPTTEDGGVDRLEITCLMCGAYYTSPVDPHNRWLGRVTLGLGHESRCPVPGRLALAQGAYRN